MTSTHRLPVVLAVLGALSLTGVAGAQEQSQGFGNSFGGLQVQGDQPVAIESNQLDVDDGQSLATFSGDVSVRQGQTSMNAEKLLVYYVRNQEGGAQPAAQRSNMPGGSGDISRLEATGKVTIRSADQTATANKAEFDMKTQVALLTGDVVLSQGKNVATGCVLRIQMDTGVARLQSNNCGGASGGGGRVRMLLSPGAGGAPGTN
ncbi:LptA/OstA family protein [Aureimonas sp. AU22]|jgi:lipopolysaccharide export system protein LptA|uniref:LptA/OstA family protein n=1 Tax=Aureimonas sp. AU22 TaxID=1638162 RepID=UPI000782FA8E|nr:LptA/OstA family protein [Aureimonas sp. AU22]